MLRKAGIILGRLWGRGLRIGIAFGVFVDVLLLLLLLLIHLPESLNLPLQSLLVRCNNRVPTKFVLLNALNLS